MSSIQDEIWKQSQGMDLSNFRCDTCANYNGKCVCKKNIFIAFVGANLSNCWGYENGIKCPHCRGMLAGGKP